MLRGEKSITGQKGIYCGGKKGKTSGVAVDWVFFLRIPPRTESRANRQNIDHLSLSHTHTHACHLGRERNVKHSHVYTFKKKCTQHDTWDRNSIDIQLVQTNKIKLQCEVKQCTFDSELFLGRSRTLCGHFARHLCATLAAVDLSSPPLCFHLPPPPRVHICYFPSGLTLSSLGHTWSTQWAFQNNRWHEEQM